MANRPATASLHSATPKRKNVPHFIDLAGGIFLKNGKDIFLFGVLPSKYSGSVAGLQFGRGFAKTIFWEKGFRKTSTNFFLKFGGNSDFVRAQEGSGEECARACFLFLAGFQMEFHYCKVVIGRDCKI